MPRKSEPFGHFRRFRLGFDNFFLKLPLSEKAIIRSFSKDPVSAYEKYSRRRADGNTLEAISAAGKKFDSALAADSESGKEIQLEIDKLSAELESIQMKRVSINRTYLRLKPYLEGSEKDHYLNSLKRFDLEIRSEKGWLLHLERILSEVKKAAALPSAIEFLKAGLADAKGKNKSEIA